MFATRCRNLQAIDTDEMEFNSWICTPRIRALSRHNPLIILWHCTLFPFFLVAILLCREFSWVELGRNNEEHHTIVAQCWVCVCIQSHYTYVRQMNTNQLLQKKLILSTDFVAVFVFFSFFFFYRAWKQKTKLNWVVNLSRLQPQPIY